MIFWHVGGTIAIFRYVFRDPKVDLRFLAVGALLPDLIDKPLGTILFPAVFNSNSQVVGHTLLFSTMLMSIVLLTTRRGRVRRRWMALAVGGLIHLLLDGMWTVQETFLWPVFGWDFPPGSPEYWSGLLARLFSDPWRIVQEAVGLGYLVYLFRKAGLSDPDRRRDLLRTGRVS
ncbi:MAG: metal-dependent hydrolase [Acidimicrobiia bacterium]|nr:metal-dependent hydrolase [Acidimicrobiia bacterium]MDH3396624.1 metal-dependent hydrolase [Acidimicrobiia bacterium]